MLLCIAKYFRGHNKLKEIIDHVFLLLEVHSVQSESLSSIKKGETQVASLWYIKGETICLCNGFVACLLSFILVLVLYQWVSYSIAHLWGSSFRSIHFLAYIFQTICVWVWTIRFKSISCILRTRTKFEIDSSHVTSRISKYI